MNTWHFNKDIKMKPNTNTSQEALTVWQWLRIMGHIDIVYCWWTTHSFVWGPVNPHQVEFIEQFIMTIAIMKYRYIYIHNIALYNIYIKNKYCMLSNQFYIHTELKGSGCVHVRVSLCLCECVHTQEINASHHVYCTNSRSGSSSESVRRWNQRYHLTAYGIHINDNET